jgi:hypothetical protein
MIITTAASNSAGEKWYPDYGQPGERASMARHYEQIGRDPTAVTRCIHLPITYPLPTSSFAM